MKLSDFLGALNEDFTVSLKIKTENGSTELIKFKSSGYMTLSAEALDRNILNWTYDLNEIVVWLE